MTRPTTPFALGTCLSLSLLSAVLAWAEADAQETTTDRGQQIRMEMVSGHARCSAFFDAFNKELARRPELETSERAEMLVAVHLKIASAASINVDGVSDPDRFARDEVRRQAQLLSEASQTAEGNGAFMQAELDGCIALMNEMKAIMDG